VLLTVIFLAWALICNGFRCWSKAIARSPRRRLVHARPHGDRRLWRADVRLGAGHGAAGRAAAAAGAGHVRVLARSAPSLNIFALGLPMGVLGGMAALIASAPLLDDA
jgi:hypothetical protein